MIIFLLMVSSPIARMTVDRFQLVSKIAEASQKRNSGIFGRAAEALKRRDFLPDDDTSDVRR